MKNCHESNRKNGHRIEKNKTTRLFTQDQIHVGNKRVVKNRIECQRTMGKIIHLGLVHSRVALGKKNHLNFTTAIFPSVKQALHLQL